MPTRLIIAYCLIAALCLIALGLLGWRAAKRRRSRRSSSTRINVRIDEDGPPG